MKSDRPAMATVDIFSFCSEQLSPMWKTYWNLAGIVLAASALGGAAAEEPAKGRPAEEKEVRAAVDAFVRAFNKADAKGIATLFAQEGEAVDPDGQTIHGRPALEAHYASRFAESTADKVANSVDAIAFLAPGVARVTGRTELTPAGGGTPLADRYSALYVKHDGHWLIASVRELPDEELAHYEHLKELEWLVGDWVEETGDAVVLTSVAWTDNKNFLLRSFDVRIKGKPALTGTQRIGWDPLTKQIKSWVFDSRGGHGEGLWTRSGDQWAVKAIGVRPDGRVATATQVLTYVNKDTLRWKSFDRTLGGEIEQDIDEVVMVRKPPQPK
ncbi:MAG: SgcJ/EcaC family oxidoreductase [Isosphaeraceae bacterium]|nr:SgcJ/EcaC family oxidoreductase [Isosphaeraceae bacterium]